MTRQEFSLACAAPILTALFAAYLAARILGGNP